MSELTITTAVQSSIKFRTLLREIRQQAIENEFPSLLQSDEPVDLDWNFALFCASALTSETGETAQELALRVAIGCLSSDVASETHKAAAAGLLERLGNRRTLDLAESRDLVEEDAWSGLPAALRLDVMRRRMELTVARTNDSDLAVNAFQSAFWDAALSSQWVSVSAPTSAGKSRIIREWFSERLRIHESLSAVYVVPTRALVEEVAEDFRRLKLPSVGVFTLPWDPSSASSSKSVYILTQERLHLIQHDRKGFHVDLLFVDEAQNLGDASRGVLLQQVIDQAVQNNPSVQVLFASPLSSNPEMLLDSAPDRVATVAFTSETVTVSQNLIHVRSVKGKPLLREFWLIQDGKPEFVSQFSIPNRASHIPKRLAFVAHALGGSSGGNLVYVNTASEAENVAKSLFESMSDGADNPHEEDIANLQELIRTAIHPKYALADYIAHGVAFHYGNMPLAIRSEVERLFHTGAIKYLVCTSTLLEGVNLPCRNIFMRNPQKGRGNPISAADFWNLAGRAGRWGTEFQGNIVCVDTNDDSIWENLTTVRKRAPLQRSVDKGLSDVQDLIRQSKSQVPAGEEDGRSESVFSYLCSRKIEGRSIDQLLATIPTLEERKDLENTLDATIASLRFPPALVSRHAGISPVAMQRLLHYFQQSKRSVLELALPVPEEKDSKEQYKAAFQILSEILTTAFGGEKRQWQLANLVVNWMHGMPLARLIDQRIANSDKATSAVIREVMSDVEKVARFQAPKYLACYLDLLRFHAEEVGGDDIGPFPDVTMMLELGVSRVTEVSLMSLGLSRTATIAMSRFVNEDDLTPGQALEWLRRQNIEGLNLPVLVQREVMTRTAENAEG